VEAGTTTQVQIEL